MTHEITKEKIRPVIENGVYVRELANRIAGRAEAVLPKIGKEEIGAGDIAELRQNVGSLKVLKQKVEDLEMAINMLESALENQ